MPKVYKVACRGTGCEGITGQDYYVSSNANGALECVYRVGEPTYPLEHTGGLFAFLTLEAAREYARSDGFTIIFEAETTHIEAAPDLIPRNVRDMHRVYYFWAKRLVEPISGLGKTPPGSVLCPNITLLHQVPVEE